MTKITKWYSQLTANPDDLTPVLDAYEAYMDEYEEGIREANDLSNRGPQGAMDSAMRLPGIYAYRWAQLQEIEQIIGFLENREKRLLGVKRRHFREHYARDLNDSMVEKYAESDPEVLDLAEIRNMFALVRNKFLALTKQHEILNYQISNVAKLKDKGIEGSRWPT
jgi:hypothetical protein